MEKRGRSAGAVRPSRYAVRLRVNGGWVDQFPETVSVPRLFASPVPSILSV
jgi:hypothetical protein